MASGFILRKALVGTLLSSATALVTSLGSLAPAALVGAVASGYSAPAQALTCGTPNEHGQCLSGSASQFGGGFTPPSGGFGGFGGATGCTVTRTPVVFIHGNGDNAISWDGPPRSVSGFVTPPRSVYDEFRAAGYTDCELFGVTYLSSSEISNPAGNFHQPSKYTIIQNFINRVRSHTGRSQVDIVSHSLGVSMTMATMKYFGTAGQVRRFVNIAGALRGLESCIGVGPANALFPTCGSQNFGDPFIFGFFPAGVNIFFPNPWTGDTSASLRRFPGTLGSGTIRFYTIMAGTKDQVMCAAGTLGICSSSPALPAGTNVIGQYNVGRGTDRNGDGSGGIGHMKARGNTGKIIVKMLTTTCTTGCAADYIAGSHGTAPSF
jgi:pimeloyl-ACP methyl ester carboxylesterase